jgi:hypothetical protein
MAELKTSASGGTLGEKRDRADRSNSLMRTTWAVPALSAERGGESEA